MTYFSVTTTMSAQKISDRTPRTMSGGAKAGVAPAARAASRKA
jgi:hypothetical protein